MCIIRVYSRNRSLVLYTRQVIYLSSLIRCTIALHNLVNNKIKYKEQEELGFADKKDAAAPGATTPAAPTPAAAAGDKAKDKKDSKAP